MLWNTGRKCKDLAKRFVAAVNAHDVDAIAGFVTEDFTYIDSLRAGIVGRDKMMAATRVLMELDPGFGIEVEAMSYSEPYVLMRGWANSSNPDFGRRRAVWRARCEDGLIAEWQSWADGGVPSMTRTYGPAEAQDLSDRASETPAAP